MPFKAISQIVGSAMAAQTVRLNTVASNLANAHSASDSEAGTYRARKPVFAAIAMPRVPGGELVAGARVQVLDVIKSDAPLTKAYEPDNPLADAQGNVFYPNVNPVAEMADMMAASRAFETNVEVLQRVRAMQQSILKLGEG